MATNISKLLFTPEAGLYYGILRDNKVHGHFAIQLTIANRKKFVCISENDESIHDLLLIESGQHHQIDSQGQPIIILLLDPLSPPGWYLRTIRYLNPPEPKKIEELFFVIENFDPNDSIRNCLEQVLRLLEINNQPTKVQDQRVQSTLERIIEYSVDGISLDKLANAVNLSPSRLQHLFKIHTGVPITRYMMWERMKKAIAFAGSENNLTNSAYGAGFADSAHMSREFKKMFGFSPSMAMKDSRNVQVYFDNSR